MSTDLRDDAGGLSDERLRFYLRHRSQIEEWIALGREVRAATLELFESFQPDMTELAASMGSDIECQYVGQGGWPRYSFSRISWPRLPLEPLVAITLECTKDRVDPGHDNPPYIGVRVVGPIGAAVAESLKQQVSTLQGKYKRSSPIWPLYRPLPATSGPDWWLDIPGWRAELLQQVAESWNDLEPHVTAALDAGLGTPGGLAPPAASDV